MTKNEVKHDKVLPFTTLVTLNLVQGLIKGC